MSEVLHANIFFFIASVATVVFSILLCVLLYHVVKILQAVRRIVERVEKESEVIAEDVAQLRAFVMEGSLISQIISFFLGRRGRSARTRASRKKASDVTDEEL